MTFLRGLREWWRDLGNPYRQAAERREAAAVEAERQARANAVEAMRVPPLISKIRATALFESHVCQALASYCGMAAWHHQQGEVRHMTESAARGVLDAIRRLDEDFPGWDRAL